MNRLGNIKLPPFSAAVNVAGQAIRQVMPSRSEATRDQPGERVHFAQINQNHTSHGGTDEHHEMSNMKNTNPFLNMQAPAFEAEHSFNEEGGYQKASRQSRVSSADLSEASDFVEGKSEVKINEYQAAWNVTNAIQVFSSNFILYYSW